jgi:hypothetical protein
MRRGVLRPRDPHDFEEKGRGIEPVIRSGVSAERHHLKTTGEICGGLPTRRYGTGESFTVPLKIRAPGFAGHSSAPESAQQFAFLAFDATPTIPFQSV